MSELKLQEIQEINSQEALVKWQVQNSNIERLLGTQSALTEQIETLDTNINDWNGAKNILETLKDYKVEHKKEFILKIINQAFKDIFQENYRLDIIPKDSKGKSIASNRGFDIIFYQNDIEISRNDNLLTSNGGGVLSIASLFFKILIGYLYSKNKFYIFDEALSQVSPQYRGRLSRFLREFCEQYDFTLVVVSQTEELEEHAHLVYEVDASVGDNGVPILKIADVKSSFENGGIPEPGFPKENFFYSNLKNFQSIVDETFIYKGFTIIRGPNNSGKSATLRAIEALLFNNFKIDNYPRKNPGGPKLTTEITFGFQGTEGSIPKEIGLKYKDGSSKVMFIIKGNEYFGKSLAGDKLKEAVEEIGFKYIDVKSMYKNFKGPLKDQTERIAYTNQYDGMFLIGAKTSDSEKIFSFLFNTENIALAIQQSKEAILTFNKEHKDAQVELSIINEDLGKARILAEYYNKFYYYMLLKEAVNIETEVIYLRDRKILTEELYKNALGLIEIQSSLEEEYLISSSTQALQARQSLNDININKVSNLNLNYTGLVDVYEAQNEGTIFRDSLSELQNKALYNNNQLGIVEKLSNLTSNLLLMKNTFVISDSIQNYQNSIQVIEAMVPRLQGLHTLSLNLSLEDNIKYYKDRQVYPERKQELDLEYNLHECSSCSGLGVVPS